MTLEPANALATARVHGGLSQGAPEEQNALLLIPATLPRLSMTRPVSIMPLGDSLTVFDCRLNAYTNADDRAIFNPLNATPAFSIFPKGSFWITAQGGYRSHLGSLLSDSSVAPPWSYVGRQFTCGSHEGYAGETIEWIQQNVAADAIAAANPDVILFLGGTNDFFWPPPRGSRDPLAVATRLRKLLNVTFMSAPNVSFHLSTVTPINATRCAHYDTARWHPGNCPDDMQQNIVEYNAMLPAIVDEYLAQGRDISLVRQPDDFMPEDYWIWGIHFNVSGFQRIAERWHGSLMRWYTSDAGKRVLSRAGSRAECPPTRTSSTWTSDLLSHPAEP